MKPVEEEARLILKELPEDSIMRSTDRRWLFDSIVDLVAERERDVIEDLREQIERAMGAAYDNPFEYRRLIRAVFRDHARA